MTAYILLGSLLVGYASGSIPFGYLAGRLAGKDVRQQGSGNIGATNVARVLGWKWGGPVLVLDALKGFLPVWGLSLLTAGWTEGLSWYLQAPQRSALAGAAAMAGHLWPFALGFRGGKGVATSLGVTAALTVIFPEAISLPLLAAAGTWLIVFLAFRYVSLASILATLAFPVAYFTATPAPYDLRNLGLTLVSTVFPLLIIWRHRQNIARLLRGEEHRWGRRD